MGNMILLADTLPVLPIFNITPLTFLITIINTGVLVVLYRFFLHKKVNDILEQRKDAIKADFDEAALTKGKAEALEKKYNELIANSKTESERILSAATARGREIADELESAAKESAVQIRSKAQTEIERERKRAMNEIKNEISGLVVMAASAVVEKEISEQDNAALIDSFLAKAGA
ncbi:MAG: F0F1 ATP synthase subunit B [Oscillospiraceae bacterium]|nr:F0F1 ATP synthase subunit B [Oscillospiraceae bacterium]